MYSAVDNGWISSAKAAFTSDDRWILTNPNRLNFSAVVEIDSRSRYPLD
jgi:hypothetical protein